MVMMKKHSIASKKVLPNLNPLKLARRNRNDRDIYLISLKTFLIKPFHKYLLSNQELSPLYF